MQQECFPLCLLCGIRGSPLGTWFAAAISLLLHHIAGLGLPSSVNHEVIMLSPPNCLQFSVWYAGFYLKFQGNGIVSP